MSIHTSTLTLEKWYRLNVRRASPGRAQLEITVPAEIVRKLGLQRGDYLWVSFSKEAPD